MLKFFELINMLEFFVYVLFLFFVAEKITGHITANELDEQSWNRS